MKTKIPKIKMTACVSAQTAIKNKSQEKAYLKTVQPSSLKIKMGELLLCLQTPLGEMERNQYRRQFEMTLREYIDLKLDEVQL